LTFPSHAPSLYSVMRGCYILSTLRDKGRDLLVSFRECQEVVGVCGVKHDEDMGMTA